MRIKILLFIAAFGLFASAFAQTPAFIQAKWDADSVFIRGASLKLRDNVTHNAHLIFKGKKNSEFIITSARTFSGTEIKERIYAQIGGYYTGHLTVTSVEYKHDYVAESWWTSINYEFRNGKDVGQIRLNFDETAGTLQCVSGFVFLGESKKVLDFEIADWLNVATQ